MLLPHSLPLFVLRRRSQPVGGAVRTVLSDYIRRRQLRVLPRHLQRRVSEHLLQRKHIASIAQVLHGEEAAEHVDAALFGWDSRYISVRINCAY